MSTPLSDFGEFELIQQLTENIKLKQPSSVLGVGDDAAIITPPEGKQQVLTTDLLLEGVHFDLTYVPLKHLGYKAVMVNLSDVFAMNAKPAQITVSLGISSKFSIEQIEELYSGIYLAAERFSVDVVGGDTSASLNGLLISITCTGYAKEENIVRRSGAQPTDLVCVSGNLGAAYMGLLLLEREKRVFEADPNPFFSPDFQGREYLIERQLKPEARGDVIMFLEQHKLLPTSMIDISDGLSSELLHISHKSGVGVHIYEDKIPIDYETVAAAEDMSISPITAALNGGEDYELLFTLPLSMYDHIQGESSIHVIGHITPSSEGCALITRDGVKIPLVAQGWNAQNVLEKDSKTK